MSSTWSDIRPDIESDKPAPTNQSHSRRGVRHEQSDATFDHSQWETPRCLEYDSSQPTGQTLSRSYAASDRG